MVNRHRKEGRMERPSPHAVDPLQMLGPKPANHLEILQAQNGRDSALLHGMAGICTAPRQVYSWLLFVYIVNKSNKIQ